MSNVIFGKDLYQSIKDFLIENKISKTIVLLDENTAMYCLPHFKKNQTFSYNLIEIKAGEEQKTIATVQNIWQQMIDYSADRNSLLINLGGGVITDMGGFAALTYKRGISFINIPTTLLGMVDAATGGKTGIDFEGLKNQIGIIHEPDIIGIDTTFLETLPEREMISGMAEVFKYGFIADKLLLENLKSIDLIKPSIEIIETCVRIKENIVNQDPNEKSIRKILNFGHTLGHAIESYYLTKSEDKQLKHGEAIAIGMIMALYLSHLKTGLSKKELEEGLQILVDRFPMIKINDQDQKKIISLLKHDKKNRGNDLQFVLLEAIGKPVWNISVNEKDILKVFDIYRKLVQ